MNGKKVWKLLFWIVEEGMEEKTETSIMGVIGRNGKENGNDYNGL